MGAYRLKQCLHCFEFESRHSDHEKALNSKEFGAFSYFLPTFSYIFLRQVNKKVNKLYVLIGIDSKKKGNVINGKYHAKQERRQGYLLQIQGLRGAG